MILYYKMPLINMEMCQVCDRKEAFAEIDLFVKTNAIFVNCTTVKKDHDRIRIFMKYLESGNDKYCEFILAEKELTVDEHGEKYGSREADGEFLNSSTGSRMKKYFHQKEDVLRTMKAPPVKTMKTTPESDPEYAEAQRKDAIVDKVSAFSCLALFTFLMAGLITFWCDAPGEVSITFMILALIASAVGIPTLLYIYRKDRR